MPRDYGYFGKGSTGYAQYMTAFRRSRKGGGGGGGSRGGCFLLLLGGLAVLAVIEALVTARTSKRPCFCKEKQGPTCYAGVGMRVTVTAM